MPQGKELDRVIKRCFKYGLELDEDRKMRKKILTKIMFNFFFLRLRKIPILKIKPMVVTSLLHGAPQLKLEAREALKAVNPLWGF